MGVFPVIPFVHICSPDLFSLPDQDIFCVHFFAQFQRRGRRGGGSEPRHSRGSIRQFMPDSLVTSHPNIIPRMLIRRLRRQISCSSQLWSWRHTKHALQLPVYFCCLFFPVAASLIAVRSYTHELNANCFFKTNTLNLPISFTPR
jgi:hypothetical protein